MTEKQKHGEVPSLTSAFNVRPDMTVDVRATFGIVAKNDRAPAFSPGAHALQSFVPERDDAYHFDPEVTESILAGFTYNRRVLVHGMFGTGKTSHIEQVAARLNWPALRINLDGQISRTDLLGRDAIILQDGKQVTDFKPGLLPWALQSPIALIVDEYDAGRPDIMFVLQRVLEKNGRLTLLEKNTVLDPHSACRIFGTANTNGLGDTTGLYHGTQPVNQSQMDRWQIVERLDYLQPAVEESIVLTKVSALANAHGRKNVQAMVKFANLTREAFAANTLSTLMSPRGVITWAENTEIFGDKGRALRKTFMNRLDPQDQATIAEYFQRCFGEELKLPAPRMTAGSKPAP